MSRLERNRLLDPQKGPYSSIRMVESVLGVRLLNLNNVCYDIYNRCTYLYSLDDKKVSTKSLPESLCELVVLLLDFPQKSWNFKVVKSKPPSTGYWDESDGSYLIMSHSNRNIAHFMEVFNFVYHYLDHRTLYPPLNTIYFLQYQRDSVYPWILSYIDVTAPFFQSRICLNSVHGGHGDDGQRRTYLFSTCCLMNRTNYGIDWCWQNFQLFLWRCFHIDS